MLQFTTLGSGSAGNAALVQDGRTRLLLDAGLSGKQIRLRLGALGVDPASLDGILITHEHIDHCGALAVFCKKYEVPIVCNTLTAEVLRRETMAHYTNWRIFHTGRTFSIGSIEVESFSVPHDAVDPVGFLISSGSGALGVLTDMGYATKLALDCVRQAHTLLIETNHDEKLLQEDSKRPWSVKQRILSRHGHLSNHAAAEVARQLAEQGAIRRFVLGHLSRDCNTPEHARGAVCQSLGLDPANTNGTDIFCATQRECSPTFAVGKEAALRVEERFVQARLF